MDVRAPVGKTIGAVPARPVPQPRDLRAAAGSATILRWHGNGAPTRTCPAQS